MQNAVDEMIELKLGKDDLLSPLAHTTQQVSIPKNDMSGCHDCVSTQNIIDYEIQNGSAL